MKRLLTFSILLSLLMIGCKYEAPLAKEHNIAIDPAVLGLWEPIPEGEEKSESDERMLILKYSDTEYLVHHPVGKKGLYYRCYPVKIENIACVQLQVIGTGDGPIANDEKNLFLVASYQLTKDVLEIKLLNSDIVSGELNTTEGLVNAFVKHKENKDLFISLGKFRKVKSDL